MADSLIYFRDSFKDTKGAEYIGAIGDATIELTTHILIGDYTFPIGNIAAIVSGFVGENLPKGVLDLRT